MPDLSLTGRVISTAPLRAVAQVEAARFLSWCPQMAAGRTPCSTALPGLGIVDPKATSLRTRLVISMARRSVMAPMALGPFSSSRLEMAAGRIVRFTILRVEATDNIRLVP